MASVPRGRCQIFVVLMLATAGCFAPKPTPAELANAHVSPFDQAASVAGTYEDNAEGSPGVSLWNMLTGAANRFDAANQPAGNRTVRLDIESGKLTAELVQSATVLKHEQLPLTFNKAYFTGNYSSVRPTSPCVPAAYVAEELVVGRRNDGALIVVSQSKAWLFPLPIFSSGDDKPWVTVFRRTTTPTQPPTRPAGAD